MIVIENAIIKQNEIDMLNKIIDGEYPNFRMKATNGDLPLVRFHQWSADSASPELWGELNNNADLTLKIMEACFSGEHVKLYDLKDVFREHYERAQKYSKEGDGEARDSELCDAAEVASKILLFKEV
jgi:hypothetical protein